MCVFCWWGVLGMGCVRFGVWVCLGCSWGGLCFLGFGCLFFVCSIYICLGVGACLFCFVLVCMGLGCFVFVVGLLAVCYFGVW